MKDIKKAGFICFGEVNTPYERLVIKHDRAVELLRQMDIELEDAGVVVDDPEYKTADAAGSRLESAKICCLIVCVAGWIPSHAVIRAVDRFRHIPMLLWGMCGWKENGHIVTTADQAGTTALRPLDVYKRQVYCEPEGLGFCLRGDGHQYAVRRFRCGTV